MKKLLIIFGILFLAGCTSQHLQGIGSGTDAYKESPCACMTIEQPNYYSLEFAHG